MTLTKHMNWVAKIIIFIFLISIIVYFFYWLWQRQPKEAPQTPNPQTLQDQIVKPQEKETTISTTPQDGTIIEAQEIEFLVKTDTNSYVAIMGQDFQKITKTDSIGQAQTKITPKENLNLLKVIIFSKDLTKTIDKEIAIYKKPAKDKKNSDEFAVL